MKIDFADPCPCQSGSSYAECCAPFHKGKSPETAVKLMRSRYSAYALELVDYLINTTHPASPQYMHNLAEWRRKLKEFCKYTEFTGLKVLNDQEGETSAYVTFTAFLSQQGDDASFTEKSLFSKHQDKWLYRCGQVSEGHQPSLATNSPPRLLPLAYYGDPILETEAQPVVSITEDIHTLVDRMIETMDACDGIGIAAPQVHHSIKLFVIRQPEPSDSGHLDFGNVEVFINPEITNPSEKKWKASEGCLSIPAVHAEVERPLQVTVEYTNLKGEKIKKRVSGWEARMIQHENDHVKGVLFIDYLKGKERKKIEPLLAALKNRIHDGTEL